MEGQTPFVAHSHNSKKFSGEIEASVEHLVDNADNIGDWFVDTHD